MALGFPGSLEASVAAGCDTRRISPTLARGGMIASQHPLVSSAGLRVLAAGGNAVDAAVATAAELALMEPDPVKAAQLMRRAAHALTHRGASER